MGHFLFPENDAKILKICKKAYFDKQTSCAATMRWLKYTTYIIDNYVHNSKKNKANLSLVVPKTLKKLLLESFQTLSYGQRK